jgi:hypothetical protein
MYLCTYTYLPKGGVGVNNSYKERLTKDRRTTDTHDVLNKFAGVCPSISLSTSPNTPNLSQRRMKQKMQKAEATAEDSEDGS